MRVVRSPEDLLRLRRWRLLAALAREAGWRHVTTLALFSGLSSLLDLAGLGVGVSVVLGSGGIVPVAMSTRLSLPQGLALLVVLMLVRGGLQVIVATGKERLRSGFTDRLRQQLLGQVLQAPSTRLELLGRGALLGLLMADITRSVFALDQAIQALQALLALGLSASGVLLVGRQAAAPLLLALAATGAAALWQRSGSWHLGRLQTSLNGTIQRTVGDGLHGLKAVRAAAASPWLLQRFSADTHRYRHVLRQTVKRQALFNAWRDTFVVLVVGLWMLWGGRTLAPAAIGTLLLLAYRTGTSLSAVISAQRHCLGALPGYEELCKRRELLSSPGTRLQGEVLTATTVKALSQPDLWQGLVWHTACPDGPEETLQVPSGALVAVVGPSGSGKTTLVDRFCGLLGEEHSHWRIQSQQQEWTISGPAGARQLRQLLSYAPQQAVLFEASLRENLELGHSRDPELLAHWLERLGMAYLLQRDGGLDSPLNLALDHYSGGEIHRLGLLRAWLRDRPVEVLDEPTAYLDEQAAQEVRSIVRERSRRHCVLVSTHDTTLIAMAAHVVTLQSADRQVAASHHHGHR